MKIIKKSDSNQNITISNQKNQCLEYALEYLRLGWSVLPIRPRSKIPFVKWKPYQEKRPTESEVERWWKSYQKAGVGVVTGKISNLLTIDYDSVDAQNRFCAQFGGRETTICFKSREGHEQDLFHYPMAHTIGPIVGLIEGVDIRAEGSIFIAPPSIHKSGSVYEWIGINPLEMGIEDIIDLPEDILNFILSRQNKSERKGKEKKVIDESKRQSSNYPQWLEEIIHGVDQGSRDNAATRIAGYFLNQYKGNKEKTLLLMEGWNTRNNPPLTDIELNKVINSISSVQDKDEFRVYSGLDIEEVVFHKAPRGDGSKYEFRIAGYKESIIMTSADLIVSNKFRTKFLDLTGHMLPPMKNNNYVPLMQKMINNAKRTILSSDVTIDGLIIDLISEQINSKAIGDELNEIDRLIVVKDNKIYLKIKIIKNAMGHIEINILSRYDIAQILKNIGFEHNRIRDEEGIMHRVWIILVSKFEIFISEQDNILEINTIFNS